MRVMKFVADEDGKRTYQHLYTAMLAGGDVRGQEQLRRVGKIMDKLEEIGVKESVISQNEKGENVAATRWQLKEDGGELWLDAEEHSELTSRFNATNWVPGAARLVAKSLDLLSKAPEVNPKALLAEARAAAAAPAPALTEAAPQAT